MKKGLWVVTAEKAFRKDSTTPANLWTLSGGRTRQLLFPTPESEFTPSFSLQCLQASPCLFSLAYCQENIPGALNYTLKTKSGIGK